MYSIQKLADVLHAKMLYMPDPTRIIAHVLIDSRKLIFVENALFIAISGPRNDGHQYLTDVYDAGVKNFIVEEGAWQPQWPTQFPEANFIGVANGLKALQQVAQFHRSRFSLPVAAITGSNGKTIVKEWLAHLLKDTFNVVRSPKSFNSQVGVPLSVLQIREEHTLGIFEAGISEPGEMPLLQHVIQPSTGIFTFLGDAHDKGFSDKEQKLLQKLSLFKHCTQVVYCSDQPLVDQAFRNFALAHPACRLISWSKMQPGSGLFIQVEPTANGTQLKLGNSVVHLSLTDEAAIWNACTCLAFVESLRIDLTTVLPRFTDLPVLDMRLQLKEAHNNCLLINDSYSADLGSLHIALDFLKQHAASYKRTAIISDIPESGKNTEPLYLDVARALQQAGIEKLIGIGSAITSQQALFNQHEKYFYDDTRAFINDLPGQYFHDEIILLKGARKFAFEKISRQLEKKIHQTVLEVNLNALVNNLNVYKAQLAPGVKVMVMVKAFSYGSGSYEIAKVLAFNRVSYLTVAYADEGVTLRKAGIKTPIMVMNPEENSFNTIIAYNLEAEIYNFEILNSLLTAADGEETGVHIELDTGMKRLGFDADQLEELIRLLKQNAQVKIKSVFTHLAASEAPEHEAFTLEQVNRFTHMADKISAAFNYPVLRHCLNSGGITRFKHAQFDMVRLGIGLYGIDPAENVQQQLQHIGTLKTVISQVRHISADESIGYGRRGHLNREGRIAIVAIGYADGLDRRLSNGNGYMLINNKPAPVVGNVCMDMTMLDVTGIDCKVGDEVIVFGDRPHLNELAMQTGTIPYELLTGISQRVKRVYYDE